MGDISIRGRSPLLEGGRVGLKSGSSKTVSQTAATENIISRASEKMKSEVTEAAKKKSDKLAEAAKIKRDKSQARHVSPGGGSKYKYGPHKVDINRRDTEALFGKGNLQEKFIKFANKFDAKQDKKREAKTTKKKMQDRAKKLTAYEGTT